MTTIHIRTTVRSDGSVIIPVGRDEAGQEVEVTVSGPLSSSRVNVTEEEYRRVIQETAGSIDDPGFVRPDLGNIDPIPPLDSED